MTVNAARMLDQVDAALVRLGRDVTLRQYATAYDITEGTTTRTPTDHTARATPPYNKVRSVGSDSQPNGISAMTLSAKGLSVTPRPGDSIHFGTESWTIDSVATHSIRTTVLAYELTIQQGAPA